MWQMKLLESSVFRLISKGIAFRHRIGGVGCTVSQSSVVKTKLKQPKQWKEGKKVNHLILSITAFRVQTER